MRRAGDTTASTPVAGEALGTDLDGIGMTEVTPTDALTTGTPIDAFSPVNRQQHFDHHSIWANLGSNFMLIFNKYSSWIPTYLNCCILEKKRYIL